MNMWGWGAREEVEEVGKSQTILSLIEGLGVIINATESQRKVWREETRSNVLFKKDYSDCFVECRY